MLADDAQRIATAIEERLTAAGGAPTAVRATVTAQETRPTSIPAGAGRPVFRRYYIRIADDTRAAVLDLGQAGGLLDEVTEGWDPDRLFAAIEAREVPVEHEPAPQAPPEPPGGPPREPS